MSDYQAVYDAVRSCFSGCDVGSVLTDVTQQAFDVSNVVQLAHEAIGRISCEMTRPSAIYRPVLYQDGDSWIALYGEDLQIGVVGCGETPEAAMAAFDQTWNNRAPKQPRKRREVNDGVFGLLGLSHRTGEGA